MRKFFQIEALSGIILFACTVIALLWTNSSIHESYDKIWRFSIARNSLHFWINDGLMTIFFLTVGLEIKQEFLNGALSSRKKASLPIISALGGMIIPAIIYMIFNQGTKSSTGWGIPMATDIAFVFGIITFFGNRVPQTLKIFLLTLAIVDDIGAVCVIAFFYTVQIFWFNLVVGLGILGFLIILNRLKIQKTSIYLILGFFIWVCFLHSGIHTTIAGILLACTLPMKTGFRVMNLFHPWVSFGIIPLFALANAGVSFSSDIITINSINLGIITGLVIGKPLGIIVFSFLAVRLGFCVLPKMMKWKDICAAGCLAGIGFTMSLFIANIAFNDGYFVNIAKPAILVASMISGSIGSMFFLIRRTR